MTEIVESVQVGEPAGEVWELIGRFGAVAAWHPMLATVTAEGEDIGALRRARSIDGLRTRCRWRPGHLPVKGVGELRVDDNGDGTSTVVYSARFEPTLSDFRSIEEIRGFLKTGLSSIVDLHRKVLK